MLHTYLYMFLHAAAWVAQHVLLVEAACSFAQPCLVAEVLWFRHCKHMAPALCLFEELSRSALQLLSTVVF